MTPYEGDDSQRPLTSDEHYEGLLGSSGPSGFPGDSKQPWYLQFQQKIGHEAANYANIGRPPTWGHLCQRLITLIVEGAVRLRRWLIWLAPFIGMAYIVYDVILR
ncbi:hypothetical protein [Candidatus Poriferisocius sp.]|uniref:hypothetical protein n=1 Tax=Candidatus Poriferisocius sp. TaxID=3101276 RepID=UPI003B01F5A8